MARAADPFSISGLLTAPDAEFTNEHLFLGALLGLAVGLFLFLNGFQALRRRRTMQNTPTSKIRSVAMGRVEVYGAIVPFQEITQAPISGTTCVYFDYRIEERHEYKDEHGNLKESWQEIDSGKWSVPFFVQDDTGKILVDPKGAQIDSPNDRVNMPMIEPDIPPNLRSRISLPRRDILRYTERYLRPGESVFVLGFAGHNPHLAETSQDTAAAGKMIQTNGRDIFYISDRRQEEIMTYDLSLTRQSIAGGAILMVVSLLLAVYALSLG